MSGYDQVLTIMSVIGFGWIVAALVQVRLLDKHEREAAAARRSEINPAE